jgi:hypothetical protein
LQQPSSPSVLFVQQQSYSGRSTEFANLRVSAPSFVVVEEADNASIDLGIELAFSTDESGAT